MFEKIIKLPVSETITGDFGTIKINTNFDNYYTEKLSIYQKVQRFPLDNKKESIIDFTIESDLYNIKENLILHPKYEYDGTALKYWEITAFFKKRHDGYFFEGNIGAYDEGSSYCHIDDDTYNKARAQVIEMCNPNCVYDFNSIVDLLRNEELPEVNYFPKWWDILAEKDKIKVKQR